VGVAVSVLAAVVLLGDLHMLAGVVEAQAGPALALGELPERSLVYAADGSLLSVLHSEENRAPVALEEVPQTVVDAVLAVEDARFWDHDGVDARSAARALFENVDAGSVEQGGSTITQQLVKNALLTPDRSVRRKVREAVLARRLEQQLSKREILERYLNTVYFGNGAYGVQAAAETYFGVGVADLGPAQAALLAGVIRNPVNDDPVRFPARARLRRDMALDRMVEVGDLASPEAVRLKTEPVPTSVRRPLPGPDHYFVERVKQQLLDDRRLGETAQERYNAVFNGGLRVHTTLDPRLQRSAQTRVSETLPDTEGRFTAALVSVEPATGAVRALVGGPGFDRFKYDIATQGTGRQPGSSFKPFVLVAALEAGIGPKSTIDGRSPCTIPMPAGQEPWKPENYEGSGGGVMSVADATVRSLNCAYARLGLAVGLDKVADAARRLGITTPLDTVPAMSLGAEEVRPLDMASAYATLANDGVRMAPYFVERVEDRKGRVLFTGRGEGERAVSEQVARIANDVLQGVVQRGTGTRARLSGRQVAGKTGTSQEWQNAWFVGYTPQLSTAVWMGSPDGNVSMRNVGGVRVAGGTYPARIWQAFMSDALAGTDPAAFVAPDPARIPPATVVRLPGEPPPRPEARRPRRRAPAPSPASPDDPPPGFETPSFPSCFPFCDTR
jgi:penicillin-binding protein 1A